MIAGLRGEVTDGIFIVVALEIVARPPEMILGDAFAGLIGGVVDIGRGGQVGARKVVNFQHVGENPARDRVVVWIAVFPAPAEGLVAFVVARPEHKGGVVAEPLDHILRFLAHQSRERLIVGVDRARHGEILPDHHAVAVAVVVQKIVFIDVSAPAADDVAAEVVEHGEDFGEALLVPRVKSVDGHPVRPHGENALAVDDEAEFAVAGLIGRAGAFELYGADPGFDRIAVLQQILVVELRRQAVQARLAVIARPPQPRIWNAQEDDAAGVPQLFGVFDFLPVAFENQPQAEFMDVLRADPGVEDDPQLRALLACADGVGEQVADAALRPAVDVHMLPYAAGDGPRHDVPAVLRGRLAHAQRIVLIGQGVGKRSGFLPPRFQRGRADMDKQLMTAGG